ncbi:threonine ammonia-lyase [Actinomadura verrucosospora]|uniref:threonine ammonia-lyase n=1 Tax=Actinomadura verrucosospora TaxID=46165 RepID=A0A7D3ZY51_ACTVE|nr:threonine/serine dehydratase [Actinomadura verrucosospora]QKG22746.1 pyridoxal-5'-phosphate-dependent protein subunit beta [Actinomadura verrucosospora]
MSDLVSLPEIESAAERLAGVTVRTPLVPFPGAGDEATLLVKAESLQPIGAFKLRGAYATISGLPPEQRERGVVTHSSGNHAQAVAYTARALGIPAVLVMPHTTPGVKVDACIALGAEIVYVEPNSEAREETAAKLAAAHGFTLIPPYDDARVIAGQGTAGLEIVRDRPDVDVVLVPVSGGGLIAGVAAAVKALRPAAKVIGVEPELAADAGDSMRAGRPVTWDAEKTGRTIADALRVQRVGDLPFAHMQEYVDGMVTVTDDEIRRTMRRLAREARLVAEPAGAVATAAYLHHRDELPPGRTYVSVLSGGNVDPALFLDVLR